MEAVNLLIVGVGGQGVVLASDIIGETALAAGYDVKKTDTLGMAQRGGSVISHVRLGQKVYSPLIREGAVDIILGFEKLEAVRWLPYLRRDGVMIVNNQALPPLSVSLGVDKYPADKEVRDAVRQVTPKFYLVEAQKRAAELGNMRTVNVFMLGCVSDFMPVDPAFWTDCISLMTPEKARAVNLAAFELGRKELAGVRI